MKKIVLFSLLFIILSLGMTSALQESLGTFQQGKVVRITQVCSDATYINISSVSYPNSSVALGEQQMNLIASGEYYFDFNDTTYIGRYDVRGVSNGCELTFSTYFDITPSGSTNVLGLFIIVIVVAYAIGFIGFFGKHEWVSILGGLAMMVLGLYISQNGIDVHRNYLTIAFSYFTIGLGGIFTLIPVIEMIRD